MATKPARSWGLVLTLGIPLVIVGISAMAISYVTLIDVARVHALPLPELFPILIDVGTVTTMIVAAQIKLRGIGGRWIAYTMFILLSVVSIAANSTHSVSAADMTQTTPWAAAIIAATPPAVLLGITHLVMLLIPDEKERAKIQANRERTERAQAQQPSQNLQTSKPVAPVDPPAHADIPAQRKEVAPLRLVSAEVGAADAEVREMVLEYFTEHGKRPVGKQVGEWLGKTPKTGQRFLKRMEDDGEFAANDAAIPRSVNLP